MMYSKRAKILAVGTDSALGINGMNLAPYLLIKRLNAIIQVIIREKIKLVT